MLRRLRIENLAVVESAVIEFAPGFNVLTGSTGAGKSLIVGAVNLLLGEKGGADLIRRDAEEAAVEATFAGIDLAGAEGEIRVERRLSRSGRSSARVDGRTVPLRELRSICARFIEPHGQNEQYRLRDPEAHVGYVDAFARNVEERAAWAQALAEWRRARAELERFDAETARLSEQRELFTHRLQEIERLAPRPGEKAELETAARIMANAEKMFAALDETCALLHDDDDAAAARVGHARRRLDVIGAIDPRVAALDERLAQAESLVTDVAGEARAIRDALEFEADDVERVQERLEALSRMEKRYRASIEEILEESTRWRAGLAGLEDASANRSALVVDVDARARNLAAAGGRLSDSRRRAAAELDRRVTAELEGLMMPGARFRTEIASLADAGGLVVSPGAAVAVFEHGLDVVRMRVRTNPGEEEGALEAIASTGELSRIALVLKPLTAADVTGRTLIFDEIDAGVGADLGDALAQKLLALAAAHQIICITHMAQIAARGHTHLVVRKATDEDRTRVLVCPVAGEERTREIVRMLGGGVGSERRRALAEELLAGSRTRRGGTHARP